MTEVSKATSKTSEIKEKIIVALDVESAAKAREIVAELRDEVGAFKIGLQLFTSAGASFVREMIALDTRIFLDLKFHDIPNTVAKAAIEAARIGVWMFNVHALGGSEMMRKTIEETGEFCAKENLTKPKIIAVTVLTSSDQETLREVGIKSNTAEEVLNLAKLTKKSGLNGVVASPQETKLIRDHIEGENFLIVTPGIRVAQPSKFRVSGSESENQIGTNDDQKRVTSASAAVRAGSDYLVIGRPILQANDKILAVREIIKEIENQ